MAFGSARGQTGLAVLGRSEEQFALVGLARIDHVVAVEVGEHWMHLFLPSYS